MDIYCPRCGEPWDHDSLHEAADEQGTNYRTVAANFRAKGCAALGWGSASCDAAAADSSPAMANTVTRARLTEAMYDLLGEDMDGAAAMFSDAQYLGVID